MYVTKMSYPVYYALYANGLEQPTSTKLGFRLALLSIQICYPITLITVKEGSQYSTRNKAYLFLSPNILQCYFFVITPHSSIKVVISYTITFHKT